MPDPRPRLTPEQRAAVDFAMHTLNEARQADLAAMDAAALILLVESLRGRLDDLVRSLAPPSE